MVTDVDRLVGSVVEWLIVASLLRVVGIPFENRAFGISLVNGVSESVPPFKLVDVGDVLAIAPFRSLCEGV